MGQYAVLIDKKVVPVSDVLKWAESFEQSDRRVGYDILDGTKVSTVFLGLDHGFGGTPLWFETMIFGGERGGYQERYSTWEEAEEGHRRAVRLAKGFLP